LQSWLTISSSALTVILAAGHKSIKELAFGSSRVSWCAISGPSCRYSKGRHQLDACPKRDRDAPCFPRAGYEQQGPSQNDEGRHKAGRSGSRQVVEGERPRNGSRRSARYDPPHSGLGLGGGQCRDSRLATVANNSHRPRAKSIARNRSRIKSRWAGEERCEGWLVSRSAILKLVRARIMHLGHGRYECGRGRSRGCHQLQPARSWQCERRAQ